GASFEDAQELATRQAERQITDLIREAVEENLPADADPSDWTWQSLTSWFNARYGQNLKDKDLRKFAKSDRDELVLERDELEEFLVAKASATIHALDLPPAREFLQEDWGRRSLAGWLHHKFGLALDPAAWANLPKAKVVAQVVAEARVLYA